MKTVEILNKFLSFFQQRGHTLVPSASSIALGDPTILFTIAGMTQFKACLTGEEIRSYKRATSVQKCIRVADLDDVGKDGRHCTMFEMLGSWSFGDYGKQDAIAWAYEFVRDELKFDLQRLWITVHHSDDEAAVLWEKLGVPPERIVRLGDKDNFWAMGPTGPCGPCTELYLDQGENVGQCAEQGIVCKGPGCDCDRYLEFWNLVFMQYNRTQEGTLLDLPMKSVDTGMGLERVAALAQGKTSAFDTDRFMSIKEEILRVAGLPVEWESLPSALQTCCNVIADHIRMLTFTLCDGANFSNEGRGYVLRRVLRRALRYVHKLTASQGWNPKNSFLAQLVPIVSKGWGALYPELLSQQRYAQNAIKEEELRFSQTLEQGLIKFQTLAQTASQSPTKIFSGESLFALHDSFGFPSDLTQILCQEQGLICDLAGFDRLMKEQQERSRAEAKFYKYDADPAPWTLIGRASPEEDKNFVGYDIQENEVYQQQSFYQIFLTEGALKSIRQLQNKCFEAIWAHTPFYPEGGGQVADEGEVLLATETGQHFLFEVVDVRKTPSAIVHVLKSSHFHDQPLLDTATITQLWAKAQVTLRVNMTKRRATTRNHTATHLLHKALQMVCGPLVRQAGSLVSSEGLRFDFSHGKALTTEEIQKVEDIVNAEILKNTAVVTYESVPLEEAKAKGAMAMFDEKYDDRVRVLDILGFSLELCGGTHVRKTGEIGLCQIVSEGSVTSGVRRIEALTGTGALQHIRTLSMRQQAASELLKSSPLEMLAKISQLQDQLKNQEQLADSLESRLAHQTAVYLLQEQTLMLGNTPCIVTLIAQVKGPHELEKICDALKVQSPCVALVAGLWEGKATIVAAISPSLRENLPKLHAGNLLKETCQILGGKGGGRPDFARGGAPSLSKWDEAKLHAQNLLASWTM